MAHGGRARGEMGGGHQRAVWEQQKVLKNLTTGAGAKAWGGWPRRRWGHQKAPDGGWGGGRG